jgi:hypothetical protein
MAAGVNSDEGAQVIEKSCGEISEMVRVERDQGATSAAKE